MVSALVWLDDDLKMIDKIRPDLTSLLDVQILISETKLYTRLESLIECSDTIARQDQYA